jgi:hypothetical protein
MRRHLERLYMNSITIYSRAPGTPGEIQRPYPSDPVAARARREAELQARIAQIHADGDAMVARILAWPSMLSGGSSGSGSEEGRRARAERLELLRLRDARRREAFAASVSSAPSARRAVATGPVVRFRKGDVTPAGDVVREVRADGAVTYGRASHVRHWSVTSRPVVRIGGGR